MSGRPKDSGSHENISAALGLFLETTSHAILPELLLKRAAECHFPLQEMQVTGPKKTVFVPWAAVLPRHINYAAGFAHIVPMRIQTPTHPF